MTEPFVVAVSNRKGGTGKTATAVNVATAWADQGQPTLLVDLDSQGHAGLGVGIRPERGQAGSQQCLEGHVALEDAVVASVVPGLDVLPADTRSPREPDVAPRALANVLAGSAGRWQRVVVDTPPSAGVMLDNALGAAQGVIVPLQPHTLAAEGVRQLVQIFFRMASGVNPGLEHLAIVPVMLDTRVRLHRRVVEDLARQFGRFRILRGVRSDIRIAEAFAAGRPVGRHAPRSRGAMDYTMLVEELATLWGLDDAA